MFIRFTANPNEMEDAGAETQPDLVTACKQPPESKVIQKCLIP